MWYTCKQYHYRAPPYRYSNQSNSHSNCLTCNMNDYILWQPIYIDSFLLILGVSLSAGSPVISKWFYRHCVRRGGWTRNTDWQVGKQTFPPSKSIPPLTTNLVRWPSRYRGPCSRNLKRKREERRIQNAAHPPYPPSSRDCHIFLREFPLLGRPSGYILHQFHVTEVWYEAS